MKNRLTKRQSLATLLASLALVLSLLGTQAALADSGGAPGHDFDVSFTKWITSYPNMAGVVGGDVGTGTFAGEILSLTPSADGSTLTIDALYHINGGIHSFSVEVLVTQNNLTGTATITSVGTIADGWLHGWPVRGAYNVLSGCPGNPSGPCFQGTLQIHVES